MSNRSSSSRPPALSRDHARPRNLPAPDNPAIEQRLAELIHPLTYGLLQQYRLLGLRWRILNLPVMLALILALIWRQVPSVTTLAEMLSREKLLWAPPIRVSQQALSLRLRSLPAQLFYDVLEAVLPQLLVRAMARLRPQAAIITRTMHHFDRLWVLDATTLEELFCKVGLLRDAPRTPLGGKLLALLDAPTKLPVRLWLDDNPDANEKSFLDQVKPFLQAKTLILIDRGFYSFPFFDWLTDNFLFFVTRARSLTAYSVVNTLAETPTVHDYIIALGQYRSNPCSHLVRLVELSIEGKWHRYLTNVLDPTVLSTTDVIQLYGRRWDIEETFLLVKRLLGLAYLWTGAINGIHMQVWATWLLYAVLVDLSDAIADQLSLPLDQISLEMVFRSLYHFCGAYRRGEATDPVTYLASQPDLHIVKRRRKHREGVGLDKTPGNLNL